MSSLKTSIGKISSSKASNWRQKAVERRNQPWLRAYSTKIARRILTAIEGREDMNQARLAELLAVSPQQISKIVKGRENLTLETIYKLSGALNVELISFPDYKYNYQYAPLVVEGRAESVCFRQLDFAIGRSFSGFAVASITAISATQRTKDRSLVLNVYNVNLLNSNTAHESTGY